MLVFNVRINFYEKYENKIIKWLNKQQIDFIQYEKGMNPVWNGVEAEKKQKWKKLKRNRVKVQNIYAEEAGTQIKLIDTDINRFFF